MTIHGSIRSEVNANIFVFNVIVERVRLDISTKN